MAMTKGRITEPMSDRDAELEMRRRSRRAFLVGGGALLAGAAGWRWLLSTAAEDGIHSPFRRVLGLNEKIAGGYFSGSHLAPVFPPDRARMPRANGDIGLSEGFDPVAWRLTVANPANGAAPASTFALDDIRRLPRVDMVTELKCIEGWSEVVHWGGARLIDFMVANRLGTKSGQAPDPEHRPDDLLRYVAMETPDKAYFVGLEMASAIHPQTLLCYEMNGQPLAPEHGAPLRLVTPVKYGIKHIKRIGTIRFSDRRPDDYWAKEGYDWYAGL
ncbi:MAG: molybdopterin-dependent oxidoreductase [Candidatus Kapaibacterium sp.]